MHETLTPDWYQLTDPETLDSPALLIFPDRVEENIQQLIRISGDVNRLRPHVKTHKMAEVADMHIRAGIHKFKCSTIAEAEMLGESHAQDVLLAYQAVGPKLHRLIKLAQTYPSTQYGTLVDDEGVLRKISNACETAQLSLQIWMDVNNGMGRTGIKPDLQAEKLFALMHTLPGIIPKGLHAYDGQFRQSEFANRKSASDQAFDSVFSLRDKLIQKGLEVENIIAGGSPTFPVHALREEIDLSPGTYVFWDAGYAEMCPELPFQPAAVVMARVISKPDKNLLCLDLGHKGIAGENPIENRVRFLNAEVVAFRKHSEEHLVVEVTDSNKHVVGEVWYGVPWHICPTVALYQEGNVLKNGLVEEQWPVIARDRRIRI